MRQFSVISMLLFSLPPAYAGDARAKLTAGEILSTSVQQRGIWPGRAMGVVDAPAEQVYRLLADFENYEQFVPRVFKSHRSAGGLFTLHAKFPWPVEKTRVDLEVRHGRRGPVYVVQWKMKNGTLKSFEGAAWIQAWGSDRCLLTYQMLAVPRGIAPHSMMAFGLRKAVEGFVGAVRKRLKDGVTAAKHSAEPGVAVPRPPSAG